MIIDRFGSTYATAYQLPGRMMRDDLATRRQPVTAQVAGADGVFDFSGDAAPPLSALTIKKSGLIVPDVLAPFTGTGEVNVTTGSNTIGGPSCAFLTDVRVGDVIVADGYTYTVTAIASNTALTVIPAGQTTTAVRVAYTVRPKSVRWSQLDTSLDALRAATIAVGESKLWGLLRDGTQRWAHAKCVGLRCPEQVGQIAHQPVDLEFYLREGSIWYGASEQTGAGSGTTPQTVTCTNSGNVLTPVRAYMSGSGSAGITSITINNTTNGSGWVWAGAGGFTGVWTLTVDAAAATALKTYPTSTSAYDDLTINNPFEFWLYLSPGSNSISVSYTGTGFTGVAFYWYNAWVM